MTRSTIPSALPPPRPYTGARDALRAVTKGGAGAREALRFAVAGLCAVLAGCSTSPGGPPAIYMSISLVDGTGTTHPPLCTQFPVLVGSRVTDRQEIPGDLIVRADLDRSVAQITFVGAETTTVTYSVTQIQAGVSGDPIEVAGRQRDYEAVVRSGCP